MTPSSSPAGPASQVLLNLCDDASVSLASDCAHLEHDALGLCASSKIEGREGQGTGNAERARTRHTMSRSSPTWTTRRRAAESTPSLACVANANARADAGGSRRQRPIRLPPPQLKTAGDKDAGTRLVSTSPRPSPVGSVIPASSALPAPPMYILPSSVTQTECIYDAATKLHRPLCCQGHTRSDGDQRV